MPGDVATLLILTKYALGAHLCELGLDKESQHWLFLTTEDSTPVNFSFEISLGKK